MQCEFTNDCVFFNDGMERMPSTTPLFKRMYCKGNRLNCARYMVAKRMGSGNIPSTLYPNNRQEAFKMLSACRKFIK